MPKRRRILIIDDEADTRDVLRRRLKTSGFDVLEAANGPSGFDIAKQQKPDLIILDILMPGQDGLQTYRFLVQDPLTRTIPIIFLTALSARIPSGFQKNHYVLGKPYNPIELIQLIQKALTGELHATAKAEMTQRESQKRTVHGGPKRILVIDDDIDARQIARHQLTAAGYSVFAARDGLEGLSLARQDPPDLIILDLIMPKQDGLKVYQTLKQGPGTKEIPVIFLTGLASESDLMGKGLGKDSVVLGKPYTSDQLVQEVHRALKE